MSELTTHPQRAQLFVSNEARLKWHDTAVWFVRDALKLGAQVHWARDADEHNRIVQGLLEKRGVKRLVKSK